MLDKKDIYKQVLIVLTKLNSDLVKKIPQGVFDKLIELAADSDVRVVIDTTKPIEEQNISEESKDIISLIYYNCIAEENEKEELIKIWNYNDNNHN